MFVGFMQSAIKEAPTEAATLDGPMATNEKRKHEIERFLKTKDTITNTDVRELFAVSSATANRILAKLAKDGMLEKVRLGKSWRCRKK